MRNVWWCWLDCYCYSYSIMVVLNLNTGSSTSLFNCRKKELKHIKLVFFVFCTLFPRTKKTQEGLVHIKRKQTIKQLHALLVPPNLTSSILDLILDSSCKEFTTQQPSSSSYYYYLLSSSSNTLFPFNCSSFFFFFN